MNEIGLSAAVVEWLEEYVQKPHGIQVACTVNGTDERIDGDLRTILFRNIRELVINVIKHAQAGHVAIDLNFERDRTQIVVRDDGIGFDVDAASTSKVKDGGFGIFTVQERMADMGGSFDITSQDGQGTDAQQVELGQAQRLDVIVVKLGDQKPFGRPL